MRSVGVAQMGTMDAEALSATRGQTGQTSEIRRRAVMRAHLRDRHTPWVSLLCAVVAMVRRDDCLVQLSDAEEAEQRALEGRPDGSTRCWSSAAPAAPTPNFEGEDVPAREHGAVEASTTVEAMQSEQLLSLATYAAARDPAMAIGTATGLSLPPDAAETPFHLVPHGGATGLLGATVLSGHEVDAFMRTAKKQRRKAKLQSMWYCGYCRHYTGRTEERCANCQTTKADVAGQDEAAALRLESRKSRKKGRQQNSVGAGDARSIV